MQIILRFKDGTNLYQLDCGHYAMHPFPIVPCFFCKHGASVHKSKVAITIHHRKLETFFREDRISEQLQRHIK